MLNFLLLEVDNNPIINGSTTHSTPVQVTNQVTASTSIPSQNLPQANVTTFDFMSTIFVYIALFFAVYWFFIRPQKKRQEELMKFQDSLKPGDDVITASGLHGKIIEVTEKTFIIEFGLNKGIRIPVSKSHVMAMEDEQ
jgi:preprotein translocase, YajC subunit